MLRWQVTEEVLHPRPFHALPVSAVVMKLLSKTAEERYQGSVGLKADEFIVRLPKHPAEGSSTPGNRGLGDRGAPHSKG